MRHKATWQNKRCNLTTAATAGLSWFETAPVAHSGDKSLLTMRNRHFWPWIGPRANLSNPHGEFAPAFGRPGRMKRAKFTSPAGPAGRGRIALAIRVRGSAPSIDRKPSPGASHRPLPAGEVKSSAPSSQQNQCFIPLFLFRRTAAARKGCGCMSRTTRARLWHQAISAAAT